MFINLQGLFILPVVVSYRGLLEQVYGFLLEMGKVEGKEGKAGGSGGSTMHI